MNSIEKMQFLENDRTKYKRYCKNCGHPIIFPTTSKKDKKVCTHCGYYIYKNDRIEFEEILKSKIKREV